MTRRYVHPDQLKVPEAPLPPVPAVRHPKGLDEILEIQIEGLARLTQLIVQEITGRNYTKDTAQQLAICIKVTMELKAKEKDLLDKLSEGELEAIADKEPE